MQLTRNLVFLLLGLPLCVLAQREGENWHFGEGIGVRFTNGIPLRLPESAQFTLEGSASYSDAQGNLLFYTNGGGRRPDSPQGLNPGMIWNRQHEPMYNMQGVEGGGFSARQSALVIPKPLAPRVYYLFTMEENEYNIDGKGEDRGLSYFEIDMRRNGGLGAVTVADQRVFRPAFEGLSGTQHANGRDYWVVTHHVDSANNRFVVVPVTPEGVGEPRFFPIDRKRLLGFSIKISPDGRWLYCNEALFRFDPERGSIEDPGIMLPSSFSLSTSFSADSRYLYTVIADPVLGNQISRFDLRNPDVVASRELVALLGTTLTYQMQLGPNGNLYFLEANMEGTRLGLSVIRCTSTPSPILKRNILDLTPAATATVMIPTGLPNFTDHLFRQTIRNDTIFLPTESLTYCRSAAPTLTPRVAGVSYRWSVGSTTSPTLRVSESGQYILYVLNECGQVTVDTKQVTVAEGPRVTISVLSNLPVCAGDTVRLRAAGERFDSLRWSTGDTLREIAIVAEPDQRIAVAAFGECGQAVDEVAIALFTGPVEADIVAPDQICEGDTIRVQVEGMAIDSARWSPTVTGLELSLRLATDTLLTATIYGRCGLSTQRMISLEPDFCPENCELQLPEVFTPNNDRINDSFRAFTNCPPEEFELWVVNRWGQQIFHTTDAQQGWDGTQAGRPQPNDLYLYRLLYRFPGQEEHRQAEGTVTLLR